MFPTILCFFVITLYVIRLLFGRFFLYSASPFCQPLPPPPCDDLSPLVLAEIYFTMLLFSRQVLRPYKPLLWGGCTPVFVSTVLL